MNEAGPSSSKVSDQLTRSSNYTIILFPVWVKWNQELKVGIS